MSLIFTISILLGLNIASADEDPNPAIPVTEAPEEPDMCVGCNSDSDDDEETQPQLKVEIRMDPITGEIRYVITGITIEQ